MRIGAKPTGNAVDIIAKIMGVDENVARNYLADPKYYEQLRKAVDNNINGWVWLKTDSDTRKKKYTGVSGGRNGVLKNNPSVSNENGSFCAALRVKKA